MATMKPVFGAATGISVTLASLASGSAQQSAAIDNTGAMYPDAALYVAVKLAGGTPVALKAVNIYFYGSTDGTNYTDNASGSDAPITLRNPTNLVLLGTLQTPDAGGLTYKFTLPSIAEKIGGPLPAKWGIAIENQTGVALSGVAEADHTKQYRGITLSIT